MEIHFDTLKVYDKANNLIGFVEYSNSDIKSYYKADGCILLRKFTNKYSDKVSEIMSSIIYYDEPIKLFPLYINGEASVKTISKFSEKINFSPVKINKRVDTCKENGKESYVEGFTIKNKLISEWSNKL